MTVKELIDALKKIAEEFEEGENVEVIAFDRKDYDENISVEVMAHPYKKRNIAGLIVR